MEWWDKATKWMEWEKADYSAEPQEPAGVMQSSERPPVKRYRHWWWTILAGVYFWVFLVLLFFFGIDLSKNETAGGLAITSLVVLVVSAVIGIFRLVRKAQKRTQLVFAACLAALVVAAFLFASCGGSGLTPAQKERCKELSRRLAPAPANLSGVELLAFEFGRSKNLEEWRKEFAALGC
jgi:drug/metabolite transporter (DMT)-like permease